jgi:hypothetical protein
MNDSIHRSAAFEIASAYSVAADRCNRLFILGDTQKGIDMNRREDFCPSYGEQQKLATDADGTSAEVDRNVHPTEGEILAEFLAWAKAEQDEAREWGSLDKTHNAYARGWWAGRFDACVDASRWLTAKYGCQATSTRSHEDDCNAVG